MITNEKQYQITKTHLQNFTHTLFDLKNKKKVADKILHQIYIDSIQSKIEDFQNEIAEYESKITS